MDGFSGTVSRREKKMSDLIYRQAAIEAIMKHTGMTPIAKLEAETTICRVPSAEPERNHGKWMGTVCSVCGESTSNYYDCDYCPHCGARMEE